MLTEQQRRAVEHRATSVHLASGAGCGKTHVLTARYLSHLEEADVSAIVAITFTERAAKEMRARIRTAVEKRIAEKPDDRWRKHLSDLETAPIQTIHGFCGTLLRQFADEAGVDPGFIVLDDVLALNLRWNAIREEMQELLLEESDAGGALRELTVQFGWYRVQNAIPGLLNAFDAPAWEEFLSLDFAGYEANLAKRRLPLFRMWIRYQLAEGAFAGPAEILRSLPYEGGVLPIEVQGLFERLEDLPLAKDLEAELKQLNEEAKLEKVPVFAKKTEPYERLKGALTAWRAALKSEFEAFLPADDLPAQFEAGKRFLQVASRVEAGYRRRKLENAALDYNDLVVKARDLLRDNETARGKAFALFGHLLLDELQDTDPVQMELARMLAGDLSEARLFAVGDRKQSIYRFRGADAGLFDELRKETPPEGRLDLSKNYRSQPGVLEFVNRLFQPAFPHDAPLEPSHEMRSPSPCVEFLWSFAGTEDEKPNVSEVRHREALHLAFRLHALVIAEDRPAIIWDKKAKAMRQAEPRDVCILFRSMGNVALYETALRDWGIDYYLIGGRAFFAQQEVYDILNALRAIENPNDSLALAGALRSPLGGITDDSLVVLCDGKGDLWDNLHDAGIVGRLETGQREAAERFRDCIDGWRAVKDSVPIVQLLHRILEETGYDAALMFEFLGERKLANLWKLLDLARSFDESGLFTMNDFIDRLGELVTRMPREEEAATQPEDADVVKLMSIHQSKGLEFPIVVLADINAKTGGGQFASARWQPSWGCVAKAPADEEPVLFGDTLWQWAAMEDELLDAEEAKRVFYVATTRAEDLLILSAGFAKPMPESDDPSVWKGELAVSGWMKLLAERYEMKTGRYRGEGKAPSVSVKHRQGPPAEDQMPKRGEETRRVVEVKPPEALRAEIVVNSVWNFE